MFTYTVTVQTADGAFQQFEFMSYGDQHVVSQVGQLYRSFPKWLHVTRKTLIGKTLVVHNG